MSRPISAAIDLSALRHNHRVVRHTVGTSKIWSVLKANAYGHGVEACAQALAGVTDGVALLNIEEAITLRRAGFVLPLLLVEGFFAESELTLISEYSLTPVLHRLDQVESVVRAGLPMSVYLKINTGMNRLGIAPAACQPALAQLRSARHVQGITLMTHFALADEADADSIGLQLERFAACTAGAGLPVSLANSAAIFRHPQTHQDWVRPGIALYGCSPVPQIASAEDLGLRPVMTLQSEIISAYAISAGEAVGYGATFRAAHSMRVGVVACGYADGYPRHAGTGTPVLVGGVRTRTLGRVSMDMLAVDLTDMPQANVGSPVVLWGEGLSADEVAAHAGTISYELLTGLAARVPKRVHEGG